MLHRSPLRRLRVLFPDPREHIAARLGLVIGGVALVFALLESLLVEHVTRRQVEASRRATLSQIAGQMARQLDRDMFERYREIQVIASLGQLRDPATPGESRRALLETLQGSYPDYAWIGLTDVRGRVLTSTGGVLEGADVSQRPWFSGARKGLFVGDLHDAVLLADLLPTQSSEPLRLVDIAAPVFDAQGRFQGVLGAHLSWNWAREVERSLSALTPTTSRVEVLVLQRNGTVVLGPPTLIGQTLALDPIRVAQQGTAATGVERWADGEYLLSARPSTGHRTYPGLGWIVVARQPADVAFEPVQQLSRQMLLTNGLLACMFVGLGGLLIQRATRPLRAIADGAVALQRGATTTIPAVAGRDEVARLSQTLRDLVGELARSRARYRAIVEDQTDLICRYTPDTILTFVNEAYCRNAGRTRDELLGQSFYLMLPPGNHPPLEEYVARLHATTSPAATTSQHRGLRSDGQIRLQEWIDRPLFDEHGRVVEFQAVGRDITDAHRRLDYLQALRRIDMAIVGAHGLPTTLRLCLCEVTAQLDVDGAAVLLYDAANTQLVWGAGYGLRTTALATEAIGLEGEYAGRVARDQTLISIPDMAQHPPDSFTLRLAQEGAVAYYGVPLVAQGQLVGVLEVFHRSRLAPDAEWLGFLEMLAGQLAIAVDHARLLADLQRANAELAQAYDETIEGWARALDLRDKETEGHSRRVTELTVALARTMGVGDDDLVQIRRGALLHDIGKMAVPDAVLLKPGSLTDDEWQIMRQHPQRAYELLHPIGYLGAALDIPHAHHEKWDGSGYPQGLRGEAIPLAARIFAVVDVWDALTSHRPYRAAWTPDQALAHIIGLAGSHFDPAVVWVFLTLLDEREGAS